MTKINNGTILKLSSHHVGVIKKGGEYYITGSLEVNITNKTDESQSYSIDVEALDADGVIIASDSIFVSDLGAGDTIREEAFSFEDTDTMASAASYRVSEISKY